MSRPRFGLAAFIYALLVAYASTVVGVDGPHFVSIAADEALRRLIDLHFVEHGSDQRADWMGNLVMAVPLGFLAAGWLFPGHNEPGRKASTPAAIGAFTLCAGFILLVKYLQLFFPPRTVTLNYIVAQSIGAVIGIVLFGVLRAPLDDVVRRRRHLESLRTVMRVYAGLLILFMLMPLDVALSADDLAMQLDKLADTFTEFNGEGRPVVVRLTITVASVLATTPIGALLTLMDHGRIYVGRSISASIWIGFFIMLGVYALSTMVISAAGSLPAVGVRTAGVALGAWFIHWLTRQDTNRLRNDLAGLIKWVVPFYLLTLFAVNGLLSFDWTDADTASNEHFSLGLLPLFHYYIVSKAQAAKNIVGHVVMYAPIGVMVWSRAKQGGGKATAFVLAAMLSAIVETGRFFRPGLVPDINAVPLAGIAAWTAAAMAPALWRMLTAVAIGRPATVAAETPVLNWRDRDAHRRARRREAGSPVIGNIEEY